jgi:hypothetical protein
MLQVTVEKVIAFLLRKKVPRQTEGGWGQRLGRACSLKSLPRGWSSMKGCNSAPTRPPTHLQACF